MEITAIAKFVHISPKKVQPWLKGLRQQPASAALDSLRYANTKAGKMIYKVIASAVSNAVNNYNFKPDNLCIKLLTVDGGPRSKRYWFRSHGSADVRLKRTAHIKVVLEEIVKDKATHKPAKNLTAKPSTTAPKTQKTDVKSDKTNQPPITIQKNDGVKSQKSATKRIFSRTTNK